MTPTPDPTPPVSPDPTQVLTELVTAVQTLGQDAGDLATRVQTDINQLQAQLAHQGDSNALIAGIQDALGKLQNIHTTLCNVDASNPVPPVNPTPPEPAPTPTPPTPAPPGPTPVPVPPTPAPAPPTPTPTPTPTPGPAPVPPAPEPTPSPAPPSPGPNPGPNPSPSPSPTAGVVLDPKTAKPLYQTTEDPSAVDLTAWPLASVEVDGPTGNVPLYNFSGDAPNSASPAGVSPPSWTLWQGDLSTLTPRTPQTGAEAPATQSSQTGQEPPPVTSVTEESDLTASNQPPPRRHR